MLSNLDMSAAATPGSFESGPEITRADEFRAQAEVCRQLGARSVRPEAKAVWHELAEGWLKLAQAAEQTNKRGVLRDNQRLLTDHW